MPTHWSHLTEMQHPHERKLENDYSPQSDGSETPDPTLRASGLTDLLDEYGVAGRRLLLAAELLRTRALTLGELILESGVPRRTAERLLRALDLTPPGARATVIGRPSDEQLGRLLEAVAEATRGDVSAGLSIAELQRIIEAAPRAKRDLDHVSATPDTVRRRADFLSEHFLLTDRHVVFMGDHDLTSIALAASCRQTRITVLDIDEDLLDYVQSVSTRLGLGIRCLYADFSVALPDVLLGSADLVVTDPPYTPEGVGTFLAQSTLACTRKSQTRIVMAYGFSDTHPALGLRVQQEIVRLELAIESIIPAFNRYSGAEALGAKSDLYSLIPTAKAWKIAERAVSRSVQKMYTHGARSLESTQSRSLEHSIESLAELAGLTPFAAELSSTDTCLVQSKNGEWSEHSFREVLTGQVGRKGERVLADTAEGHQSWLLRILLASNADDVAILVPNSHPHISNQAGQEQLASLLSGKYQLRFLRSRPTNSLAVVLASRAQAGIGHSRARSVFLSRPGATLRSALTDAAYRSARSAGVDSRSKESARQQAEALIVEFGVPYADAPVQSLPRSALAAVLRRVDDL